MYLHRSTAKVPPALLANLRHNNSLHETVVFVSVVTDAQPHVSPARRERVTHHPDGFHQVEMHYGFMDPIHLADDLAGLLVDDLSFAPEQTTFFLGRERIEVTNRPGMMPWRDHLFALLSRNAADPSEHFELPPERSMDLGLHVEI